MRGTEKDTFLLLQHEGSCSSPSGKSITAGGDATRDHTGSSNQCNYLCVQTAGVKPSLLSECFVTELCIFHC